MCVALWVEVHKGRKSSSNFLRVFSHPPNHKQSLSRTQKTHWAFVTLLRFVLTTESARTLVFAPRGLEPSVDRVESEVSEPGWTCICWLFGFRDLLTSGDRPNMSNSSVKNHTGIFSFWISTLRTLSFIQCSFRQRDPLCRDLAV